MMHTQRILRYASLRTVLRLAVLVSSFAALSSQAQIEQCSDRSASGQFECTYRPHLVEPWKYAIPGPVHATVPHLNEGSTKEEYAGHLAAACPNCCNPGTLVGEGNWEVHTNSGMAWTPDLPAAYRKTLTYLRVGRGWTGECELNPTTFTAYIYKNRHAWCERGVWTHASVPGQSFCFRPRRAQECRAGHPIALPSQSKVFTETDYKAPYPGGLAFVREYRSDGFSYPPNFDTNLWLELGNTWTHNYSGYVRVATVAGASPTVWVGWGQEAAQHFQVPSGSAYPRQLTPVRSGQKNRLVELSEGQYAYYTRDNKLVRFVEGRPVEVVSPNGWSVALWHLTVRLNNAQDTSGRELVFQYDSVGHLVAVYDPAMQPTRYSYKSPPRDPDGTSSDVEAFTTLSSVTYRDLTSRQYQVPDWDPLGATAWASATRIHGVVDELGALYETVAYDTDGRAVSSELAGGVDRHQVSGSGVTDPLGTTRGYQYGTASGTFTGLSQPAGSGCPASNSTTTFDANDNLASRIDFNGKRICYANDLSRNVEASRVEGLAGGTNCSAVTPVNAVLPAEARKTSTQWHPDWQLQTKLAEPGRITTYVYNGQPDPFNDGALASCAPASALLPDGKPIAVVCRQVEQATTDANGSLGFGATLQAGVANREQKWTYNQYGQVLTHDGPRSDVSDVTTYAYYSDTSFAGTGAAAVGHTIADLRSVTNAAGQVTQYTQYDKHGQLLESVDPNGVVTTHTYDLRQRLLSTSVGGQTTSYTYDAAGQLKRITKPDGSYVGFDHDPAHRQTAVFDNLGNRIGYTLDNAGNRTAESVRDAAGTLRRQLARSIDALGRVQQTTGRE